MTIEAATPAAETPAATTETPAPAVETSAAPAAETKAPTEAEVIKGFDAAVEAETKGEAPPAPKAKKEAATPEANTDPPPVEKTPEQIAAEKAIADDPAKKAEADRDAAIEKEIVDSKMKPATAERFRELAKRPTPAEVEKQLAPLKVRAEQADQWEGIIAESRATPDQLNNALGYLQAINSGNPVSMGKAYDSMLQEVAWLGKQLGREVPGLFDPLAEHADLKAKVDGGDMARADALEIARHRAEALRASANATRQTETQNAEQGRKAAIDGGIAALNTLGQSLKAANPDVYAKKFPLLKDDLAYARDNLPPDKWVGFIQRAYERITIAAPPPAPPPVGHVPLRPTGTAAGQNAKPKNALEAFDMGMAGA
jgi:hypothetical protein